METITKTFNIYSFDELSKEIQEEVIKREEEGIRENDIETFLEEEMYNIAELLLAETFNGKAILKDVLYSLNYCQGDGAMIEFDLEIYNKTLNIRNFGRYCHEYSFEIINESEEHLTDEQYNNIYDKIISINKKLKNYGYQFIEEDRTEQALEQLKDCMFYENGEVY